MLMLRQKKSYLYEENHILKRIREWPLNICCMLKKFPTKLKCSIVIYTLNVYKTSTKKPPLIHSWELNKISILRIKHCQYWKCVLPILLYYKKPKTLKL